MIHTQPSTLRMKYPIDKDFVQISRYAESLNVCTRVLLVALTEQETKDLEKEDGFIVRNIGDEVIKFTAKHCYAFGIIDFNNQEDMDMIAKFSWMKDYTPGAFVPCHYDYTTHTGDIVNGRARFVETWNNIKAIKYAHARLNKPKYVAIIGYKTKSPIKYDKRYKDE